MTVPIPYIDAQGFHMPAFADVLASHKAGYAGIYGMDVDLSDAADQDVEWVTIEAFVFQETFNLALAVYNAFSPVTAQGTGLSSVVKVNGITKKVASYSTQTVTIVGQAFITLVGQSVGDGANPWTLPTPITIPASGTIDVTATCTMLGAITVPQGTEGALLTSTRGLQSIVFSGVTSPGQPVEIDRQLKARQARSTALPAQSTLDGLEGALLALPNVTRLRLFENDGPAPDVNGLPGNSIAVVIDGGDSQAICDTILRKKGGGVGTYGAATSPLPSYDKYGIPHTINYFQVAEPPISVVVAVKALAGFTTDVQAAIQASIVAWINALGIGDGWIGSIDVGRIYGAALLSATAFASTFTITGITVARDGNTPTGALVPIAFNEAPTTSAALITVLPS